MEEIEQTVRHYLAQIGRDYREFCQKHPELADDGLFRHMIGQSNLCIGDLLQLLREVEGLVRVDGLTGLGNRRAYDEDLFKEAERAVRYKHPLALVRADVDKFKPINDTFGHRGGDAVLAGVAEVLRQGIRGADAAYRWGGDEFAILLPETDVAGATKVAEAIGERLAITRYDHDGQKIEPVCLSQGVDVFVPGGNIPYTAAALELSENADRACYESKKKGTGRISAYNRSAIPDVGGISTS